MKQKQYFRAEHHFRMRERMKAHAKHHRIRCGR